MCRLKVVGGELEASPLSRRQLALGFIVFANGAARLPVPLVWPRTAAYRYGSLQRSAAVVRALIHVLFIFHPFISHTLLNQPFTLGCSNA